MKRTITIGLLCIVASFTFPSVGMASQCWCTCTSGYRDCDNMDAKSCAKKSRSLTRCDCSWSAAGSCPVNQSEQYNKLNNIVPVNEQEDTKTLETEKFEEK